MKALEISGLEKSYPGFALRDIDLSLEQGFVLGLIGPNGAGKTTLLKAVADLVRPDAGEILLFGKPVSGHLRDAKRRMAFVHEQDYLYQDCTATQLGRIIAPFYHGWDHKRYAELMRRFGIDPGKKIAGLSKGTKTKLRIAMAFSHGAQLIIMDEPASGLDPLVRREILDLIAEELARQDCSVILSSHITEDLDRIADFVALIDHGSLVLQGPREELMESWSLVKGDPSLLGGLTDGEVRGARVSDYGFTAITHERARLEGAFPGEFLFERPNLGDLMIHLSGGQK
jgi:ABC-2 type transport system ATP-binding protein